MMRCAVPLMGCALPLTIMAFVIGFLGSFRDSELSLFGRCGVGAMLAAMTLVATVVLLLRDHERHAGPRRPIRKRLKAKADVDNAAFCGDFDLSDEDLLVDIREAVADFFDVPPTKIHSADALSDYDYGTFGSDFHMYVIACVLMKRYGDDGPCPAPENPMKDMRDLAKEVSRIVAICRPT